MEEKEATKPGQAEAVEKNPLENGETLDGSATVAADGVIDATNQAALGTPAPKGPEKKSPLKKVLDILNIYVLLFMLTLLLVGVIGFVSYQRNKQAIKKQNDIKTEPLSQEALDKLRQTDVKVGDPKQILSVESNAVFAGSVLVRNGLEVAGPIKVGSPLTLPGVTVSGNSNFEKIQANSLQVSSDTAIQGQLNVQGNLNVSGSATFGGTLTASRLNIQTLILNGDLQLNRHIDAGGGNPGKSDGNALGAGGTSSVSGTDTAGTVTINTGGGPTAGCFITVNFTQRFNGTAHVVISPVGSWAGGLSYYVNRSSTNFSVCTASTPPAGQSFQFDYVAVD